MKNFVLKKIPIILILSFVFTSIFSLFCLNVSAHTGYSGYVWVSSSSADRFVYVRPDSTSMQIGSTWTEWVTVFWKEGSYYYIEYNVSGYGGKKRGYIKETSMNNLASGIPQSNSYPSWNATCGSGTYTIYNCPNTSSYNVGSVWGNESITVLDEDEGSGTQWYYVQYTISGGFKRGYIQKSNSTPPPYISDIPSGSVYYIKNYSSGKYLDVYSGQQTNGTLVLQYTGNGDTNQQWQFKYLNNGYYVLRPMHNADFGMDVLTSDGTEGATVDIWNIGNNNSYVPDYTQWKIVSNGDGTYRFLSKCSGDNKALNIINEYAVQSGFSGISSQRWVLESAVNRYEYSSSQGNFNKINQTNLLTIMNCYSYILGRYSENYGGTQPGSIAGLSNTSLINALYSGNAYTVKTDIESRVNADILALNGKSNGFVQLSSMDEEINGSWVKVALVYSPPNAYGPDYHWYIYNDGQWYHKPSTTNVINTDAANNIITNPESSNRNFHDNGKPFPNYTSFIGYYKVWVDKVIGKRGYDDAGDILSMAKVIVGYNNSYSISGKIEYSTSASGGNILDNPTCNSDVDYYLFKVSQSGYYNITTSSSIDTVGSLYDKYGVLLNCNDDYNGNTNFRINYYLNAGNTYKISVKAYYNNVIGNYTLSINLS